MAVSATVTPGVVLSENEEVTISKLNALGTPTVNVEGAVGSLSLADGSVTNAKIATSAAIQHDKLASLSTGQLIVGNAGTPTATTVSGDVTIAADGAVTVADNVITPAKMEDGTQGDVLVYGASGAPERLGYGTDGQVLTTGGENATPSWTTVQTIGFTSAQGTATSPELASDTDFTNTGSITLTLPSGKTWLWVRVVFSTLCHSSGGIKDFEVRNGTGSSDTVFSDWVQNDPPPGVLTGNSDDILTVTWMAEGVPTDHTEDSSLTLYTYSKRYQTSGTVRKDYPSYRVLYAVGQYA